jgi:hypothetical protein
MTALYWRVTLARIEAVARECLWTWSRMLERTKVIWQRQ